MADQPSSSSIENRKPDMTEDEEMAIKIGQLTQNVPYLGGRETDVSSYIQNLQQLLKENNIPEKYYFKTLVAHLQNGAREKFREYYRAKSRMELLQVGAKRKRHEKKYITVEVYMEKPEVYREFVQFLIRSFSKN